MVSTSSQRPINYRDWLLDGGLPVNLTDLPQPKPIVHAAPALICPSSRLWQINTFRKTKD